MNGWTFVYLMVVLKIPIALLLYIVWWAVHQVPDDETEQQHGDGGARRTVAPARAAPAQPAPRPARRLGADAARAHAHRRGQGAPPQPLTAPEVRSLRDRAPSRLRSRPACVPDWPR